MSEKQSESLSALMDGELDELAMRRLFNDMESNPELKAQWSRFHLARESIKGDVSPFANLDISAAVGAALKDEPVSKEQTTQKPWFKAIAGLSVAASVTFAVVLGARFNPLNDHQIGVELADQAQPQNQQQVADFASPTLVAQGSQSIEGLDGKELQAAQERLNTYLKQHAQDSAIGQGKTAMPFARVVNFESSKEK